MSRWFRFYDDALTHPKVRTLPGTWYKFWVELLCLASKNDGDLGTVDDIAKTLRMRTDNVLRGVLELSKRGLIDRLSDRFRPHNWERRQYKSDSSTQRVREFRGKRKNIKRNVSETLHETAPEQSRVTPLTPLRGVSEKIALREEGSKGVGETTFVKLTDPRWWKLAKRYEAENGGKDVPTGMRNSGYAFPTHWINGQRKAH